jgi:isoquinoline 1-oxidoreductase alpha subunit
MAQVVRLYVNGKTRTYEGDPDRPLLWYLRDELALTGTKYGCGIARCGACSVRVDGKLVRSCALPMSSLTGKRVVTIEGIATEGRLHPVQKAWIDEDVAQCGYCQAGQIMAAIDLLERTREPTDADIDTITNLCRCGTHVRIRRAIKTASKAMRRSR